MKIYVARHGQTDWNLEGKLQGSTDVVLNKTGIDQAYFLSENLKDVNFDLIICSSLKRAVQTAEIVNKDKKLEIIYCNDLRERGFGELEGELYPEIDTYWDYDKNDSSKGVEPVKSLLDRVFTAMDKITSEYKDKNILIVSHFCVMMAIDCYFNGFKDNHNFDNYYFNNGEFVEYSIEK
ncbi:MAG: histidine phosphatase family protein [Clostridia bacterium]|nr:histidine phosphatase family protein [Clostridia bacterium]